jgi:hypothetical protein
MAEKGLTICDGSLPERSSAQRQESARSYSHDSCAPSRPKETDRGLSRPSGARCEEQRLSAEFGGPHAIAEPFGRAL